MTATVGTARGRGGGPDTTVCLVRHGETDWNREHRLQGREDIHLNERGRNQARIAAVTLQDRPWDVVVSSPLWRARETAEIIAAHLGLGAIVVMEEFIQRDYGAASGMLTHDIEQVYPDGRIPGLEDRHRLAERCMAAMRRVVAEFPGRNVVVVAHSAVIKAILADVSRYEVNIVGRSLDNTGLSFLHHRDGAWEIEAYNAITHLNPARGE